RVQVQTENSLMEFERGRKARAYVHLDTRLLLNLPVRSSAADRALTDDTHPVHNPLIDGPRSGVSPHGVGFAVAVEVAYFRDDPTRRGAADRPLAGMRRSVHQPHVHGAGIRVVPQNVGPAVAKEVTNSRDLPIQSGAADRTGTEDTDSIQQPD